MLLRIGSTTQMNGLKELNQQGVLGLDKSKDKFNKYLKDIEKLDDSYLYVQGTLNTNKVFNKKRVYNYINHINRLRDRGC